MPSLLMHAAADSRASSAPATAAASELGAFVHGLQLAQIPQAIQQRARCCLLYGLGIGLLCTEETYARVAEDAFAAIDAEAATGGATAWRSGRRFGVATAAACNTVLMHSRCQEDTSGSAHLGIVIIPTALALVEAGLADAADLLVGLVAGYEAAGALERCLGRRSTAQGSRASPLYGTLAGAATAARLLRLDPKQTVAALANAAAFAGGTLQAIGDGTDEWRYQMAGATRRGIEAAFLARAGSLATPAAFDGPRGFAAVFARGGIDAPLLAGQPWALQSVAFKAYPVCNRNQTVTALAVQLHDELDLTRVARIRFRINSFVEHGMLTRGPFESVAGTLMSTYFGCAAALAHGAVARPMLEAYGDRAIQAWIDRIEVTPDETITYPSATAEVTLHDGTVRHAQMQRTFIDYALPRNDVVALLARLAQESGLPPAPVSELEHFAFAPAHPAITPVLSAFAHVRTARQARSKETSPC